MIKLLLLFEKKQIFSGDENSAKANENRNIIQITCFRIFTLIYKSLDKAWATLRPNPRRASASLKKKSLTQTRKTLREPRRSVNGAH